MKRDLFRRYVWLVDIVRHAKKITFEEISGLWEQSSLNTDRSPLALRTFHNHRDAIENLFGIKILCDRSDHNTYYVADDSPATPTRLKIWMLQTLSNANVLRQSDKVENRIVLDITPEEKFGLMTLIEAMNGNNVVNISYRIPSEDNRTDFEVGPYCIRFFRSAWYVLGRNMQTGALQSFDLSAVKDVVMTKRRFIYPKDFSPAEYFKKYYGMDVGSDIEPYKVRLRIYGKTRDYVRYVALQDTQKEIDCLPDCSIFEYSLVPTADFINAILGMGTDCEVVSPNSLRNEVIRQIECMYEMYRDNESANAD